MKIGKMPKLYWLKVDDVKIIEQRLRSHLENHNDFEESIKLRAFSNQSMSFKMRTAFIGLQTVKIDLRR